MEIKKKDKELTNKDRKKTKKLSISLLEPERALFLLN